MNKRTADFLDEWLPWIALFGFFGLMFFGMLVSPYFDGVAENDVKIACIQQGFQWLDGDCLEVNK